VNWSILLGEKQTGNTMMLLNRGTDTGNIVDQERVEIGPDDTCATVYDKVAHAGAKMLIRHLPGLLSGTAPMTLQDPSAGDVMPKRTPAMGVLDWDRSAQEVHDWVRALTAPYPGAFTSARGQRMWVWATRDPRDESVTEAPGTVLSMGDEGVRVATAGGSILVTQVSGENEAPQPSATWCRDHGYGQGSRFDAVPTAVSAWARGLGPKPLAPAGSGGAEPS
jgi:methionyl-tRNA formyltransferase